MADPHTPSTPADNEQARVPSDVPDAEPVQRILPEGQLPGMPVYHDPLGQPMPRPAPREVPPLD